MCLDNQPRESYGQAWATYAASEGLTDEIIVHETAVLIVERGIALDDQSLNIVTSGVKNDVATVVDETIVVIGANKRVHRFGGELDGIALSLKQAGRGEVRVRGLETLLFPQMRCEWSEHLRRERGQTATEQVFF